MQVVQFSRPWKDFESNISVAFREIKKKKFLDYFLYVSDRKLKPNKLILSACSPFFRYVLRKNQR